MRTVSLALVIILFLCSCGRNAKTVTPVLKGISFTAHFTYYNESYTCEAVFEKNGKASLSFLEPESLNGLTVTCDGESVSAQFYGLTYSYRQNGAIDRAASDTFFALFREAESAGVPAVLKDGMYLLAGKIAGKPYTFRFGATGLPISLAMKETGLYADLQNVTIL